MQVLHRFKYLDIHKDSNLAFNPEMSELSGTFTIKSRIKQMKKIYHDAVKDFLPNYPPPRENPIHISCIVDSDYTGDKITRRFQSSIIPYCN